MIWAYVRSLYPFVKRIEELTVKMKIKLTWGCIESSHASFCYLNIWENSYQLLYIGMTDLWQFICKLRNTCLSSWHLHVFSRCRRLSVGFTFPRRAARGGGVRRIVRRILCGVRRILNLIFLRFLQILKRNINGDSHIDFNAFNDISNA